MLQVKLRGQRNPDYRDPELNVLVCTDLLEAGDGVHEFDI